MTRLPATRRAPAHPSEAATISIEDYRKLLKKQANTRGNKRVGGRAGDTGEGGAGVAGAPGGRAGAAGGGCAAGEYV